MLPTTGNEQGGHYLLTLHTGRRVNRYYWMEFPMPYEVIEQVHLLAFVAEKYKVIVFTDINGNILTDNFTENDVE